MIVKPYS